MSILQKHPRLLEGLYSWTRRLLLPFRSRLQPGSRVESLLIHAERLSKGLLFDCRMCGNCVLHSTGMTCPMTCPKTLRNGPCGGVRRDGNCEIVPTMPCVWVLAWERSRQMSRYADDILAIQPPLDRSLEGSSAWVNDFSGRIEPPPGWSS